MKRILMTFVMLLIGAFVYGQVGSIDNIRVDQRDDGTGFVDIYFDLTGSEDELYDIAIEASFDGGATYSLIPAEHLSGALKSVAPEEDLHIEWDGMASHPNTYSEEARVKIIAELVDEDLAPNTVRDIDGNLYPTITIEGQEWMAANLRVTRYNDGTPIPTGLSAEDWANDSDGAYAIYSHDLVDGIDSDEEMVDAYGKLYNFYTFFNNPDGLCPPGWRVPETEDWRVLVNPLRGQFEAGPFLKSTNTEPDPHPRWDQPNLDANNETGFSGIPSGNRHYLGGSYNGLGEWGMYWGTSFEFSDGEIRPRGYRLEYETTRARRYILRANTGYPVRCLRDVDTGPVELGEGYYDGPYILYEGSEVRMLTVVPGADGNAEVVDERTSVSGMPQTFTVYPDESGPDSDVRLAPFDVTLWDFQVQTQWDFEQPDKVFAISDVECSFTNAESILRAGGVIDEEYNWIFGENHLVVNGDMFSRGNDMKAMLWLLYKLDYEATQAGGKVHIIIGNHEAMNIGGDVRYVTDRYLNFADYMEIEYHHFFGANTELGRWFRTKNAMVRIGRNLIVHGGISEEFVELEYTPQEANDLVRANLGRPNSEMDSRPYFLFRTWGPLWYRGMVSTDEGRLPLYADDLAPILEYFDVDRFLVGHTKSTEVRFHREEIVACFDVDQSGARARNDSRGLLLERTPDGDNLRAVFNNGDTRRLPLRP